VRQLSGALAVPADGRGISRFASKSQLLDVTAGAAAILNHGTAFGIRSAPFDLHRPNAGNACNQTSEEAVAFSFGFDGRHGSDYTPSGSAVHLPSALTAGWFAVQGTQKIKFSEAN
jgi:hypothetical protein